MGMRNFEGHRFCQTGNNLPPQTRKIGTRCRKRHGLDWQALHFWLRRARESYHCMIYRSIQNQFFESRCSWSWSVTRWGAVGDQGLEGSQWSPAATAPRPTTSMRHRRQHRRQNARQHSSTVYFVQLSRLHAYLLFPGMDWLMLPATTSARTGFRAQQATRQARQRKPVQHNLHQHPRQRSAPCPTKKLLDPVFDRECYRGMVGTLRTALTTSGRTAGAAYGSSKLHGSLRRGIIWAIKYSLFVSLAQASDAPSSTRLPETATGQTPSSTRLPPFSCARLGR